MFVSNINLILFAIIIAFTTAFTRIIQPPNTFAGMGRPFLRRNGPFELRSRFSLRNRLVPENLEQPCGQMRLLNGRSRLKNKGRYMSFVCNKGFDLVGAKHTACKMGEWDDEVPICIKPGCPPLEKPEHGVVHFLNNNAQGLLFCDPGYELDGPSMVYCNGQRWNGTFTKCKETYTEPALSCDFESPDICGWQHDDTHDFEWRRHNYSTPSSFIFTGPQHDHTYGEGSGGHYMYMESSSRLENETARLFSPLYRGNLSSGCFVFFYHMYGRSIGSLRVYMKPEGTSLQAVLTDPDQFRMFERSHEQGNVWHLGFFYLNETADNFQIVIEGVNGPSYSSDIAVDDVAIFTEPMCANISILQLTTQVEEGGYSEIQSCVDRCDSYGNASLVSPSVEACDCTIDCAYASTCCLDYFDVCAIDYSTDVSTSSTEGVEEYSTSNAVEASTKIISSSIVTTQSTTISTTASTISTAQSTNPTNKATSKSTSKPTTVIQTTQSVRTTPQNVPDIISTSSTKTSPKITTKISSTNRTTMESKTTQSSRKEITLKSTPPQITTVAYKNAATKTNISYTKLTTKPNITPRTNQIIITSRKPIDNVDYITDEPKKDVEFIGDETISGTDKKKEQIIQNQHIEQSPRTTFSWLTLLLVMAGVIAMVSLVAFAAWRYNRRNFQYKNPNRAASQGATEEFSEVRYLTADEQLDFNIASPDY